MHNMQAIVNLQINARGGFLSVCSGLSSEYAFHFSNTVLQTSFNRWQTEDMVNYITKMNGFTVPTCSIAMVYSSRLIFIEMHKQFRVKERKSHQITDVPCALLGLMYPFTNVMSQPPCGL